MKPAGFAVRLPLALLVLLSASCALLARSPSPNHEPLATPASDPRGELLATLAGSLESPGSTGSPALGSASPTPPAEAPVRVIPLEGPLRSSDAEVSGLAWLGDRLVILPQYPGNYPGPSAAASLFSLPRSDIVGYLEGTIPGPLRPGRISFDAAGIPAKIRGFEGFEAIAFSGERVFLTIEARELTSWTGYLVAGSVSRDGASIQLDPGSITPVSPPVDLINKSDEALVVAGNEILSLFEANGRTVNPNPAAHVFDPGSLASRLVPLASVEYRITDATPADANGQFWALNTYWVGEIMLLPVEDPLALRYGEGASHARSGRVERLVRLAYDGSRVDLVDQAPIQLQLDPGEETRNWEGLAYLERQGFLIMTDEFPTTILAFVPWP